MNTYLKKLSLRLSIICLIGFLTGCVANQELSDAVKQLNEANDAASDLLSKLKTKDERLAERNKTLTEVQRQNTISTIEKLYHEKKLEMLKFRLKQESKLADFKEKTLETAQSYINEKIVGLEASVSSAEKIAESLYNESKKFPDDKELKQQAALAAADYFGRLAERNDIELSSKNDLTTSLNQEITLTRANLKKIFDKKLTELDSEKSKKVEAAEQISLSAAPSSTKTYEALEDWTKDQDDAFQDIQSYADKNNPLSDQGILSDIANGFKDGIVKTLLGKSNVVPSKEQILGSGKDLLDGVTADTKKEFDKKVKELKEDAKGVEETLEEKAKDYLNSFKLKIAEELM